MIIAENRVRRKKNVLKWLWVIFFRPKVTFDYNDKTQQCKVFIDDKHWFDRLRDYFSVKNEAKKFVKGPMKHWVKDRIYLITSTGWYNFGLTHDIVRWIKDNIADREIVFSDAFKNKFQQDPSHECIQELKLELRPYQRDCVELALKYKNGTFVLGTGAGKTLTIASIIDNLIKQKGVKRVLILVPDNNLVLQFNDELVKQYGLKAKICLFFDKFNKIDEDANVIIANRPLFLMRFLQYKDFFVNKLDCLIVDEAHSIKRNNKITKCIGKIKCDYKFGFTGTLAEERENYYKTIGLLGAVRYEKTSKELRDEGYLSNVTIRLLDLDYGERFRSMLYREELEFIQNHEKRNKFIAKASLALKNNTLILVNFLKHGFTLEETIKRMNEESGGNKAIYFVRGEIEADAREEIKRLMEENDNMVCIAITKIFSTGINIKNLHNIILASGGKSSITVVQSIGRGLRLHQNKKMLNIFDIKDNGLKYSEAHRDKRLKIYQKEQIKTKAYLCSL